MIKKTLLALSLFFPVIPILGRGGYAILTLLIGMFSLVMIFYNVFLNKKKYDLSSQKNLLTFLIFLGAMSSLSVFFDVLNGFFAVSYFYQICFFFIIVTIVVLFSSVSDNSCRREYELNSYFNFFLKCCFIISIFSLWEVYYDKSYLITQYLYKKDRLVIRELATGTFGITYFFSYFLLIPIFYYLSLFLRKLNFKSLIMFLFYTFILLKTQSRTMFLVYFIGIAIFPFFGTAKIIEVRFRYLLFLLFFGSLFSVCIYIYWEILIESFYYIYNGLDILFQTGFDLSGNSVSSHNIRLNQILNALNLQFEVPLIGRGIGSEEGIALESIYSMYIYRYGVISLVLFFVLLGTILHRLSYLARVFKHNDTISSFIMSLTCFYFLSPLALTSSASHDTIRLAVVFYGFTAIIFAIYKKEKTNDRTNIIGLSNVFRVDSHK
jgi:hypothetical protein